jgi:glyoxylase-like metal-dependent hydrolase (beta-lactamase superfamily II)
MAKRVDVVNVGYDSANYYVVGGRAPRLLIDVGWPGTMPRLLANLRRKDVPLTEIGHLLITHYHPDHAGLAQDLKSSGLQLIVLEPQLPAIPRLRSFMKPGQPFVEIEMGDNVLLTAENSRSFLKSIGIAGSMAHTPGHSDDSVTLVLDDGAAFIGDLHPPGYVDPDSADAVRRSWDAIRALKAERIYPGHGPPRALPRAP